MIAFTAVARIERRVDALPTTELAIRAARVGVTVTITITITIGVAIAVTVTIGVAIAVTVTIGVAVAVRAALAATAPGQGEHQQDQSRRTSHPNHLEASYAEGAVSIPIVILIEDGCP